MTDGTKYEMELKLPITVPMRKCPSLRSANSNYHG